jgi:hypothetical protein
MIAGSSSFCLLSIFDALGRFDLEANFKGKKGERKESKIKYL